MLSCAFLQPFRKMVSFFLCHKSKFRKRRWWFLIVLPNMIFSEKSIPFYAMCIFASIFDIFSWQSVLVLISTRNYFQQNSLKSNEILARLTTEKSCVSLWEVELTKLLTIFFHKTWHWRNAVMGNLVKLVTSLICFKIGKERDFFFWKIDR